ncbi:MAG: hypothetical protein L6R40_000617 [Gallowayella cf. fulva]|nr:MAG: hypothetical protein L6R40_000617 [Xanthomendoza cf. fulva]
MIQQEHPFHFSQDKLYTFLTAESIRSCQLKPTTRRPESIQRSADAVTLKCSLISNRFQRYQRTHRPSRLLRIPAELREQVYSELVHDQSSSLSSLLTVNRQISKEVLPWILKRPLVFNGQQCLFEWLSHIDPGYLPNVVNVRLKLHDIDPKKIMGALGERLRRAKEQSPHVGRQPYLEACDIEVTKTMNALSQFKKLKSFTLLSNTSADPRPDFCMVATLVTGIVENFPLVSFQIPQSILNKMNPSSAARHAGCPYISQIPNLQITDCDFHAIPGFPRYLPSFPNLRSLEICSADPQECFHPVYSSSPLREHTRLEEFTLCLYHYSNPIPPSGQDTSEPLRRCLNALEENIQQLRTFKVVGHHSIDRTSTPMQQFLSFVQSSSLRHVEAGVSWAPLPDQYPKSVATIAIRFEKQYARYGEWLERFQHALDNARPTFLAEHPRLKEISFYLPSEARGRLGNLGVQQSRLVAAYRERGVQVQVFFKDFCCEHRQ